MSKVEVNPKGIKNRLKGVKPYRSIAEYIWNGFDAGANTVDIDFSADELGSIYSLSIKDNGKGIPQDQLDNKFKPVLSSEKHDSEVQHTLIHGKNGLGRLTFYHFSQNIEWRTCYKSDDKYSQYTISANESSIDQYICSDIKTSEINECGTTVVFSKIFDLSEYYIKNTLITYLVKEFSWFLELQKSWGFIININGTPLSYESLVKEREDFEVGSNGKMFQVKYIQWSKKLNQHFSRYYCIGSDGDFKYSKPTTLNNKGDEFYHSIFLIDEYFNTFKCEKSDHQSDLFNANTDKSEDFKNLILEVNSFLREKRKPFIVNYAKSLVESYENKGIFPKYNTNNRWEAMRSADLKEAVSQLYQVDPRIFSHLNIPQKKTLVSFLSLIIDGGELDDLFKVLDGVVELSLAERASFAKQLKTTKMSSIVRTIELISDRYKSVAEFKKLVFDPSMYACENPHLQKMMERTYWLMGEEYQLLTAAEPKFEEALRRHSYILRGETKKKNIDHIHKNKEMDLFLIRQGKRSNRIENIVVELKHPTNIKLGKNEIDQVYKYYQVIKSEPMFNAYNMEWKFYLIGNEFDNTDFVKSQINTHKIHGEPGLVFLGEYKIYAFKWSEIFTEFELKHDFLNEKLNLELDRMVIDDHMSADEIVNGYRSSDAPCEINIPVESGKVTPIGLV